MNAPKDTNTAELMCRTFDLSSEPQEQMYTYFSHLSHHVSQTLLQVSSGNLTLSSPDILRCLQISKELELYLPFSGTLFPRREFRLSFLTNQVQSTASYFNPEHNKKLLSLSQSPFSLRLLQSIKFHIEYCLPTFEPDSQTPCAHVYSTILNNCFDPKTTKLPLKTNIEIVYRKCLLALLSHIDLNPNTEPFHGWNSSHSSLLFSISTDKLRTLVLDILFSSLRIRNPSSNFTIFTRSKCFKTSSLVKPTDENAPPATPTAVSQPLQLSPTSQQDTITTSFLFPEHDIPITLHTDIRQCIIDMFDHDWSEQQLKPLKISLNAGSSSEQLIISIVNELFKFSRLHLQELDNGYVSAETCRILADRFLTIDDARKATYNPIFEYAHFHEERRTKEDFPLLWNIFSRYLPLFKHHSDVKQLQRFTCRTLPYSLLPHELFESTCLLTHLFDYITCSNSRFLNLRLKPEHRTTETQFLKTFNSINAASFRLFHYISDIEVDFHSSPHPSVIILKQWTDTHVSDGTEWFQNSPRSLEINLNGKRLKSLKSSFLSDYRSWPINPDLLRLRTKTIMRLKQYPRHLWTSTPANTYDSPEDYIYQNEDFNDTDLLYTNFDS
jgi:hypothetical protein